MKEKQELLVSIDIGTKNIKAVLAVKKELNFEVIAYECVKAIGFEDGKIIDADKCVKSIKNLIEKIEYISSKKVKSVHLGITGKYISSFSTECSIEVYNREITNFDIEKILEDLKLANTPSEKKNIHIVVQNYRIDKQKWIIKNPINIYCEKELKLNAHIIIGEKDIIENIEKCVESADIKIESISFSPFVASHCLLENYEKKEGIVFIDLGDKISNVLIYSNSYLNDSFVFNFGGDAFTQYIANKFKISKKISEEMKIKYGDCFYDEDIKKNKDDIISIQDEKRGEDISAHRNDLIDIIEMMAKVFFNDLKQEIDAKKPRNLSISSIVLSGGASKIKNIEKVASSIFLYKANKIKLDFQTDIIGIKELMEDIAYANCIGILSFAKNKLNKKKPVKIMPKKLGFFLRIKLKFFKWLEAIA